MCGIRREPQVLSVPCQRSIALSQEIFVRSVFTLRMVAVLMVLVDCQSGG
jgi:hypothetical protein